MASAPWAQLEIVLVKRLVLVAAALSLSACGPSSELKKIAKERLIDPDSAKFGELSFSKDRHLACLNVNAKNRMGGYAGESGMFFEKGDDGKWFYVTAQGSPCDGDDAEELAKVFAG